MTKQNLQSSFFLATFKDEAKITEIGTGIMVKATHLIDERCYAIKKLSTEEPHQPLETARKEVIVISMLDHPGIVRYFSSWTEPTLAGLGPAPDPLFFDVTPIGPCLYIQHEFCQRSLQNVLAEPDSPVKGAIAWKIFFQIADALNYIHNQGIIHGHLSSGNIFVDQQFNAKIGDFSRASFEGEHLVADPVENLVPDPNRSKAGDVYSLGKVMFEIFHDIHQIGGQDEVDTHDDLVNSEWLKYEMYQQLPHPTRLPSRYQEMLHDMVHEQVDNRLTCRAILNIMKMDSQLER